MKVGIYDMIRKASANMIREPFAPILRASQSFSDVYLSFFTSSEYNAADVHQSDKLKGKKMLLHFVFS